MVLKNRTFLSKIPKRHHTPTNIVEDHSIDRLAKTISLDISIHVYRESKPDPLGDARLLKRNGKKAYSKYICLKICERFSFWFSDLRE